MRFKLSWSAIAILTVIALMGCAAGTPEPLFRVSSSTVPVERIDRLIAVAETEWRLWGSRVVRLPAGTEFCMELPGGACEVIADGCGQEQTSALCPIINRDYWSKVNPRNSHSCAKMDICDARWPADLPTPDFVPWSAAFISAMMQKAGFSSVEFAPAPAHATYVVAARDDLSSAYDVVPTPATAGPGDLICAPRGNSKITERELHLIQGGPNATIMHCDIVVRASANRTLEAIGGNVQQSVAKTIVTLDDRGRVSPTINPHRRWILVLRARVDILPYAPGGLPRVAM